MANSRNSGSPESLSDAVAASLGRHVTPGQSLVVGFSGGRDSVALLHAVRESQSEIGFRLGACHVNHGLSPHADEWQSFCSAYCEKFDVPLVIKQVDIPRSSDKGLEAAARIKRYAAFSELTADWLLLGQHRGDQAETMLFNLIRGAGLTGAAAMPETRSVRPGLKLLRPLLAVDRKQIDDYLVRHSLHWIEDESNADTGFSRNFIRHKLLPLVKSRFPAAEQSLAATAFRFAEAKVLLDELALLDLAGHSPSFPLPMACLTSLSEARGRNLLRFLLARQEVRIPSEERLVEALRQLSYAKPDRHPEVIFGNWKLCRKRSDIHLELVTPFAN